MKSTMIGETRVWVEHIKSIVRLFDHELKTHYYCVNLGDHHSEIVYPSDVGFNDAATLWEHGQL